MTQFLKKNILKTLALMKKANNTVSIADRKRRIEIIDTLGQCQDAALEIGESLETLDTGCETVISLLEDYCENLYQISQSLDDKILYRKLTNKIDKQLIAIENKIRLDLPDGKKEIVFLPYKASMWDSLESIWKAASEDETCDVYVIPIPYYNKNSDGSFGEMHYEGMEYPEYVPITSWQEYIIADRKPDVIYIHNPYDQYNRVTSVHPDFYTSKLCMYTDLLVYIPYFIAVDDYVEDHFCITQGVLKAHKVVVQSEKVRRTYIKELRKFEKENNCKGALGDIEGKILALGSPKLDKAESLNKSDYELPDEWKKILYAANGSMKKVILYNTTIESMLKKTEKMLAKLRNVLEIFKNNQEIALLWRPHPLLETTLKSMRADLAPEYKAIVEEYKTARWGILDESADMYRAIAISDAYYGDWSSVVELYKSTGKPIMIQNIETE